MMVNKYSLLINAADMALSVLDAIDNGVVDILIAFKSRFGHVSHFGDSGLNLMDQSQLEAIPNVAGNIWSVVRYQLERLIGSHLNHVDQAVSRLEEVFGSDASWNGVGQTSIRSRRSWGVLGLGASCTSDDPIGNGVRLLIFLTAYSVIEVPSVFCLQTFGWALVVVGATSEPSLWGALWSGCFESVLPCLAS
ncbi:hypothetical protein AMTR_s00052p00110670 [Amborella trichopoda]|uniref:Uncharacterized protein n=1 Tax=Amborella trichopoda TaxID=13333 RepID=U5D4N9_AMBTC|nr:hypothetical protein AMTR_s00052p00110670 [Amborella trichopoda]